MLTSVLYNSVVTVFYFVTSLPIFYQIYNTSQLIIDEEFHLKQAFHYCNGSFEIWDNKITTFPGLYILSTLFLGPFNACSVYNFRIISLISSAMNVYLIFEIRNGFNDDKKHLQFAYTALESLTIGLLPPMYFFSHLFYTDILSITFVLAMTLFSLRGKHTLSAVFGFMSILMRQTNVIWLGMLFGVTTLNRIMWKALKEIKGDDNKLNNRYRQHYGIKDIFLVMFYYLKRFRLIPKLISSICREYKGYMLVLTSFALFLYINGSIVVGDKNAHQAALHIPQIFYFSLFYIIFGISMNLNNLKTILNLLKSRWLLFTILSVIMFFIIENNTIIHPYLLADNRHYTFYIWNRFYLKYEYARFTMIPIYLFGLCSIWITLTKKTNGFRIFYCLCLIISVSLQQMIEIRYFIIPFLLLRLTTEKAQLKYLIIEFFLYGFLNAITLYIFFNKEIFWSDYKEVQRLIW